LACWKCGEGLVVCNWGLLAVLDLQGLWIWWMEVGLRPSPTLVLNRVLKGSVGFAGFVDLVDGGWSKTISNPSS